MIGLSPATMRTPGGHGPPAIGIDGVSKAFHRDGQVTHALFGG